MHGGIYIGNKKVHTLLAYPIALVVANKSIYTVIEIRNTVRTIAISSTDLRRQVIKYD